MIRSMTGFGEAEAATPAGRLRVELRSVNHRYLNVSTKLPPAFVRWETDVKEWLRGYFARGHINLSVRLEREGAAAIGMRIDPDRVAAYLALFRELGSRFDVAGVPDLSLLTRFSDIFVRDEAAESEQPDLSADELRLAIERAAEATLVMRRDEGRRLEIDLEARLTAIEASLEVIADAAPARLVAERDRLQAAVAELLQGRPVDEVRIAQEIAMLAERWDINEELVRFRSHCDHFRQLLASGSPEGVGKRLSFLVQEMNREANTTGSKANSAAIAHRVVAMKEEIERLREQVENVE